MTPPASSAAVAHRGDSMPLSRTEHDRMANAIRALAMDAVEQAKSGHPGLPMGAADVATVLFTRHLKFDPADPKWPDRDRFVLSAGHGSMLIYALLYLLGYEAMTIDQLKRFRQLGSITPGHPENFETPGWAASRVDGHDPEAIDRAIKIAKASDRPSLIACKTTIGFGAPTKAGKSSSHGSPLGADEIKGAREKLGWSYPPFEIPSDILSWWRGAGARWKSAHRAWDERFAAL